MQVTRQKGIPIGVPPSGSKEARGSFFRLDLAKGNELFPFREFILYRGGKERLVSAPRRVQCSAWNYAHHFIEEDDKAYLIGPAPLRPDVDTYVCQKHYQSLPTESAVREKFHKSWFVNVEITKL